MLKIDKVYNSMIMNSTEETDAVNNMLKTMNGINVPGLYDDYYISIETKMDTVTWATRLNFEENILFRSPTKLSTKKELLISLAEAIAYIYSATPSNMTKRIPNVISSVDNIISVLETFLVKDSNVTFKSIFEKLIIPTDCIPWEAYIETPESKERHSLLYKLYGDNSFVDVRYSSIPVSEWFNPDSIVNTADHIADYRCIETIYFLDRNNEFIDDLLYNLKYKISMCGWWNGFFAITFNISGHPLKSDIELIKASYEKMGF